MKAREEVELETHNFSKNNNPAHFGMLTRSFLLYQVLTFPYIFILKTIVHGKSRRSHLLNMESLNIIY